ncbi:hypothetical protein ACIRP0_27425 [Streptomyces sp. NPDC101733]|uniref:hypothetical protein n=1 Tax=unclassified Streptomyces TaxID=2593676 RepID=UPI00381DE33F
MGDIYELTIALDLRDELSEQELAELNWHLGIGPQPESLSIVTEFPFVVDDESGNPVIENEPCPLLAGSGAAWRVGGALCSILATRADLPGKGWSLTSRQEIHPDDFDLVGELLCWLATRAHDTHLRSDAGIWVGYLRFYEDPQPQVLRFEDGQIDGLTQDRIQGPT